MTFVRRLLILLAIQGYIVWAGLLGLNVLLQLQHRGWLP
jgi:hypothetical protein